ncbi:polysaccharide deacetylase family protein [Brevibacillus fluminis]|uniref:polysaccharide deacetylase family protein n=1 Tax=Brevibacillus fluminis TaxID=511487 RepID=UPI003F8B1430
MAKGKKTAVMNVAAKWLGMVTALTVLAGCELPGHDAGGDTKHNPALARKIVRFAGEKSKAISMVYTTRRALSLTFDGMADRETMEKLLDKLDEFHIKATFFLPGMRVAEEPDIAREIAARGHEIENNTLNRLDLTKLSYNELYSEIKLADQVIKKATGITPRYVRTKPGSYNDDVRLATAQSGQEAVVSASLFLHNWQKETDLQKSRYVRKYINRGGIIEIDTEENKNLLEDIALLANKAEEVGYQFVTLHDLIEKGGERKPLEEIPGYDAAKINLNQSGAQYRLVSSLASDKKVVALSFDDWGTDDTVTKILDLLDQYHVKASFFLRADGVEKNPNLARAIYEKGHDVGNHTYSHPVVTTITQAQLQDEIVKAHRIITEAIQHEPTMYFRPPTGVVDDKTLRTIGATGYHTIANFDVTPSDYVKTRTADGIVQAVMEQTHSGSVILLHMLDDIHTIEALPMIIEKLRSKGYSFVKMTDMFGS